MKDFTIRPPVDLEVVRILETMDFSGGSAIPSRLPEDHLDGILCSLDSSEATLSDELSCPHDYVESPDNELDSVPKFDDDPIAMGAPQPEDIPRDTETLWRILQDPQVLIFNCLGGDSLPINTIGAPVSLATILHRSVANSVMKLSMAMKSTAIHPARIFVHLLFETRVRLSRFLVLYRFHRTFQAPEAAFENQIMRDLIGPGLLNGSYRCYINAFVQKLFHILPLRLLILAWPYDDPIICELRLLFAEMSNHERTSAIFLSRICEPHFVHSKDCSEFAMQIFHALHNSSSERLRSTVEDLICFQLSTRFRGQFSQQDVIGPPEFFLHLPVSNSSTLIDCLDSFFALIPYPGQEYDTQQYSISFFPRFLFLNRHLRAL
jgi:hypothetical protein